MDDRQRTRTISDLVERHYALLYRYAYRLCGSASDAEDLAQQTFLTAQRKIEQLREPQHAKAWLIAILRNAYRKQLRDGHGERSVSLEQAPEPSEHVPADLPVDPEHLQQILGEMSEEFRTPLILYYFEEFSYREIAERLDIPPGTVMSRLNRAKRYLRGRLLSVEAVTART